MPIYEYQCTFCGKNCDLLQKFSDEPAIECPHCKQPHLQRQISAPSFHLKGSGWYVTDFKNNNKPSTQTTPESTETKDNTKENTTKETVKEMTSSEKTTQNNE